MDKNPQKVNVDCNLLYVYVFKVFFGKTTSIRYFMYLVSKLAEGP